MSPRSPASTTTPGSSAPSPAPTDRAFSPCSSRGSGAVDYLFGYDATAHVVEDWMYERVTEAHVADPSVRKRFEQSNPWALRSIAERLLVAKDRGLWDASDDAPSTLRSELLEAEGWEEGR